jgi:hypothetical protein
MTEPLSLADLRSNAFVRVVPKVISVLDYTKSFGHTDLIRVPPRSAVDEARSVRRATAHALKPFPRHAGSRA